MRKTRGPARNGAWADAVLAKAPIQNKAKEPRMPPERSSRGALSSLAAGALLLLLPGCAGTPEVLSLQYRNAAHEADYRKAKLSPPPPGMRWYSDGGEYVLANPSTGFIWKTVPTSERIER